MRPDQDQSAQIRVRDLLLEALRILDSAGIALPAIHVATALSVMGYDVAKPQFIGHGADGSSNDSALDQLGKGRKN